MIAGGDCGLDTGYATGREHPVGGRALLRWAGSKRRSIHQYRRLLPVGIDLYVEPFAGSAAIFFDRQPPRAVLSDLNGELISTYRRVRDQARAVHRHYCDFTDSEADYYRARSEFNTTARRARKAGLFLYLNRLCFNGLYRTNRKGEFNVPYGGGAKTLPRLSLDDISTAAALLGRVELMASDFMQTVLDHSGPNAFFFIDPPYFTNERRIFREYGKDHFTQQDLGRLSTALEHIDRTGGRFLLSYADVPEARELIGDWQCRTIEVTRHIAGFGGHRRSERELIVANYTLPSTK